jgi:hypothetical protein
MFDAIAYYRGRDLYRAAQKIIRKHGGEAVDLGACICCGDKAVGAKFADEDEFESVTTELRSAGLRVEVGSDPDTITFEEWERAALRLQDIYSRRSISRILNEADERIRAEPELSDTDLPTEHFEHALKLLETERADASRIAEFADLIGGVAKMLRGMPSIEIVDGDPAELEAMLESKRQPSH